MRTLLVLIITLILATAAFSQTSLKLTETAPVFSSSSLDGKYYDLSALQGSVVVMTFWSTKCAICQAEIPRLNQFTTRYQGKNVVFLALTMENEQRIEPYLRSNPFKFQILPNSFGVLLQYADRTKSGNIDMGFPSFFVVDQSGKLAYRASGYGARVAKERGVSQSSGGYQ